jgi:hypothetical protein
MSSGKRSKTHFINADNYAYLQCGLVLQVRGTRSRFDGSKEGIEAYNNWAKAVGKGTITSYKGITKRTESKQYSAEGSMHTLIRGLQNRNWENARQLFRVVWCVRRGTFIGRLGILASSCLIS